jgi:hypothetical protein
MGELIKNCDGRFEKVTPGGSDDVVKLMPPLHP